MRESNAPIKHNVPIDRDDIAARRRRARRTALWLSALAVAIYAGFLALGVIGR